MNQRRWWKLNLIWIEYEQLIMNCFDCIHGRFNLFNTNVLTSFMISLFLAASKSAKSRKPNGSISKEWLKILSFVCIQKLNFLINNIWDETFDDSEPKLRLLYNVFATSFGLAVMDCRMSFECRLKIQNPNWSSLKFSLIKTFNEPDRKSSTWFSLRSIITEMFKL